MENKNQLPELQNISHQLRTQDNRATSDPFFIVQVKNRIYGMDRNWTGNIVYIDCDGNECPEGDIEAARTGYLDRWDYVTGCFTEQAAKDFIAANFHRHRGELRVYVESLYRNPEMQLIRNFLMHDHNFTNPQSTNLMKDLIAQDHATDFEPALETFNDHEINAAIESFLNFGEESYAQPSEERGLGHRGYFSQGGFAARCLRYHLQQRKLAARAIKNV